MLAILLKPRFAGRTEQDETNRLGLLLVFWLLLLLMKKKENYRPKYAKEAKRVYVKMSCS